MTWSDWLKKPGKRLERISLEDRYLLARQMAVLQRAGVPLLASLKALAAQLPPGLLKGTLQTISQDLLRGYTLSQAFGRHPESFDRVFLGLIRTGEAAGLLDDMLKRLAVLAEWELDFRSRVKQALQYPVIVLLTLAMAMMLMLTFVLPRFVQFFSSLSIRLPWQTRVVIGVSQFLVTYGWLLLMAALAAGAALWTYARTPQGRLRLDRLALRLPVLGPLFQQIAMSRFARIVSALAASGVPMFETLELAGESVNNRYVQQGIAVVRERVRGGEPLTSAMATDGLFPPVVIQMVATGEETGRMDELLANVSDYYDQQVSYLIRKLIGYIEPALLLVVGAGVLIMATAVLVPMWDLVTVFKR